MWGNKNLFGGTNVNPQTSGSGLFGTQTSTQNNLNNNTLFGNNQSVNQPGTNLFGNSTSTGGSLFNNGNTLFGNKPQSNSLFGSTSNTNPAGSGLFFGGASQQKPFSSGFGTSTSTTQTQGSGLFGGQMNATTQQNSLFGSTQQQSLFGGLNNQNKSLFGAPAPANNTISLDFQPKVVQKQKDDMKVNNSLMNVCALDNYKNFVLEELRLNDYNLASGNTGTVAATSVTANVPFSQPVSSFGQNQSAFNFNQQQQPNSQFGSYPFANKMPSIQNPQSQGGLFQNSGMGTSQGTTSNFSLFPNQSTAGSAIGLNNSSAFGSNKPIQTAGNAFQQFGGAVTSNSATLFPQQPQQTAFGAGANVAQTGFGSFNLSTTGSAVAPLSNLSTSTAGGMLGSTLNSGFMGNQSQLTTMSNAQPFGGSAFGNSGLSAGSAFKPLGGLSTGTPGLMSQQQPPPGFTGLKMGSLPTPSSFPTSTSTASSGGMLGLSGGMSNTVLSLGSTGLSGTGLSLGGNSMMNPSTSNVNNSLGFGSLGGFNQLSTPKMGSSILSGPTNTGSIDQETLQSFQQQRMINMQLKAFARNQFSNNFSHLPSNNLLTSISPVKQENGSNIAVKSSLDSSSISSPAVINATKSVINTPTFKSYHDSKYLSPLRSIKHSVSSKHLVGKRNSLRSQLFDGMEETHHNTPTGGAAAYHPMNGFSMIGANRSDISLNLRNSGQISLFDESNLVFDFKKSRFKSGPTVAEMISESLLSTTREDEPVVNLILGKSPHQRTGAHTELGHPPQEETSISSNKDETPQKYNTILSPRVTSEKVETNKRRVSFHEPVVVYDGENCAVTRLSSGSPTFPSNSQTINGKEDNMNGTVPVMAFKLMRKDYYTIPSIVACNNMVKGGRCMVRDFVVGRHGFGSVKFVNAAVDIYGLDLDRIVFFRNSEIEVYPDDHECYRSERGDADAREFELIPKPPVGQGLNRQAEITLLNIWPSDKSDRSPIKDSSRLKAIGFIDRLKQKTAEFGGEFVDYRPEEGAWVFTVQHFTKYGINVLQDYDSSFSPSSDQFNAVALKSLNFNETTDVDEQTDVDNFEIPVISSSETELLLNAVKMQKEQSFTPIQKYQNSTIQAMKVSFFLDEIPENESIDSDQEDERMDFVESPSTLFKLSMVDRNEGESLDDSCKFTYVDKSTIGKISGKLSQVILPSFHKTSEMALAEKSENEISSIGNDSIRSMIFPNFPLCANAFTTCCSDFSEAYPSSIRMLVEKVYEIMNSPQNYSRSISNFGEFFNKLTRVNISSQSGYYGYVHINPKIMDESDLSSSLNRPSIFCHESRKMEFTCDLLMPQSAHLKRICNSNFKFGIYENVFPSRFEGKTQKYVNFTDFFGKTFQTLSTEVPSVSRSEKLLNFLLNQLPTETYSYKVFALVNILFISYTRHQDELLPWRFRIKNPGDKISLMSPAFNHYVDSSRFNRFMRWLPTLQKTNPFSQNASRSKDENVTPYMQFQRVVELILYHQEDPSAAIEYASQNGLPRLGMFLSVALGSPSEEIHNLALKQTEVVKKMNHPFIPFSLQFIFNICAQQFDSKIESVSEIYSLEDLPWSNALGIFLRFSNEPLLSLEEKFVNFHEYFQRYKSTVIDLSQKEADDSFQFTFPTPWFLESDSSLSNNTSYFAADLCYQLIMLFSSIREKTGLSSILDPAFHTPYQFDFSLSWYLMTVLESLDNISVSIDTRTHSFVTICFSEQCEFLGNWKFACYVLFHLRNPIVKKKITMDIILRNLKHSNCCSPEESEMISELVAFCVPLKWVHECMSIICLHHGNVMDQFRHSINADMWLAAQKLLLHQLVPKFILNGNINDLSEALNYLINQFDSLDSPHRHSETLAPSIFQLDSAIKYLQHPLSDVTLSVLNVPKTDLMPLINDFTKTAYSHLQILLFRKYCQMISYSIQNDVCKISELKNQVDNHLQILSSDSRPLPLEDLYEIQQRLSSEIAITGTD